MMSDSLNRHRFIRFLLAGALNTLFGFVVYTISIWLGMPVWCALLIANATGVFFNFVTIGGYAFRSLLLARLPRFTAAYAGLYVVNLTLINTLRIWVPSAIAAQAILIVPMAAASYLVMARLVFAPSVAPDGR
jgi:putative flippase GtrA